MADSAQQVGTSAIDAALCRRVEQRYVPLWLTTVFAPDVSEAFDVLGVGLAERYFATRVAPLGPVRAPVVIATFFNFSPAVLAGAIPEVWERFTPQQLLDAQLEGVHRKLTRALGSLDDGIVPEAAALLRCAAEAACEHPEGRPLFAGYASLPWPDDPHLQLWHAHYLLREFRGDGHISVLSAEGLTGIEALQLHIAFVPSVGPVFRATRGWTDDQWEASVERLRARGWLTSDDELTLTPAGRAYREEIEARTDALNVPAYEAVRTHGCERLLELGATLAPALLDDGGSAFASLLTND
jgi:hypothetical protein